MTAPFDNDAHAAIVARYELAEDEAVFLLALLRSPDLSVPDAAVTAGHDARWGKAAIARPAVRQAFREAIQDRNDQLRIIRDSIIAKLFAFANYDIRDVVGEAEVLDEDGRATGQTVVTVRSPDELPDSIAWAVTAVKRTQYGWEYKLVDKSAILLALLKHFSGQITESKHDGTAVLKKHQVEYFEAEDPKMKALEAAQKKKSQK